MADMDPKAYAEAYRQMLMGREPQGVVNKDRNLAALSRLNTTEAQQRRAGNVGERVLDGVQTKDAKPYRDLKGGR